jgi:hypothetical protein
LVRAALLVHLELQKDQTDRILYLALLQQMVAAAVVRAPITLVMLVDLVEVVVLETAQQEEPVIHQILLHHKATMVVFQIQIIPLTPMVAAVVALERQDQQRHLLAVEMAE